MNEIKNTNNIPIDRYLKKIDKKELEKLIVEVSNLDKDLVDISTFGQAIKKLLDEMEIEFREAVSNSLNIKGKMDIDADTKDTLKTLLIELENYEIDKETIYRLQDIFVEALEENIYESKKVLKLIKTYDKKLYKNIDIVEKVEKSRPMKTQMELLDMVKRQIREKENVLKVLKREFDKSLDSFLEKIIERVNLLKNSINKNIESIDIENEKLSKLLYRSLDDEELIENDNMFKKFKIDGDLEFKENIYVEVVYHRDKKMKKLEAGEDIAIKKVYRNGRWDINLVNEVKEVLKNKGIGFTELILLMGVILSTVFLLRKLFRY